MLSIGIEADLTCDRGESCLGVSFGEHPIIQTCGFTVRQTTRDIKLAARKLGWVRRGRSWLCPKCARARAVSPEGATG